MPFEDDLLWYLTWRVRQEDGIPAKTRLVKLMYLVDLYSVRDRGEQATSFRWIFYHYGPYAPDVERVIDRQLGNTIDLEETRDFFGERMYVYRIREYPPETLLPDRLRRYCDEVCDRWATAELNDLLSYVYFETPPMENAVRGQPLDLTAVRGADWPPYYSALRAPELDPVLTGRRDQWRARFERALPQVPLDPAPRVDEVYEGSREPQEEAPDEPAFRGPLAVDPALTEG